MVDVNVQKGIIKLAGQLLLAQQLKIYNRLGIIN